MSLAGPALAERAAREAVKVERAGGLLQLAGDVGRVERAAGGRAALDGLKIAKEPRDVARVAKLAEKEGSRTRAILKVAGRGAITIAAFAVRCSRLDAGRDVCRSRVRVCAQECHRACGPALFPPPPGTAQAAVNCSQLQRLRRAARHHAWRSFANGEVEIAYLDEGDGDPIVLVHGFASTKEVNWLHPGWVATLTREGRRVIALDNRGHGASGKLYDPSAYHSATMADDVRALLDHLKIERADVMGYSMGARITAFLAVKHPGRVRSAILGGLGIRLVEGVGLPESIADALEAPSLDDVRDPTGRVFRIFADQTKSDLRALAACIRGSRQTLGRAEVAAIRAPVLVAVGTKDQVAGSAAGIGRAYSGCTRARYSGPRPHAGSRRQSL